MPSTQKHEVMKIQHAIGRELAAQYEVPKTLPRRLAYLMRELHRRLRALD